MRKQTFDEAGGYRSQFMHAEDYDLCLRILEHGQVANLPVVVLRKRTHSEGVSVRNLKQQSLSALAAHALSALRERQCAEPPCDGPLISPQYVEKLGVSQAAQRRALTSAYVSWIGAMLQASQHDAVRQLFEELTDLSRPGPVPGSALSTAMLSACWVHARERRPLQALVALGRAVWASPVVAARPLKWKLSSLFRTPPASFR